MGICGGAMIWAHASRIPTASRARPTAWTSCPRDPMDPEKDHAAQHRRVRAASRQWRRSDGRRAGATRSATDASLRTDVQPASAVYGRRWRAPTRCTTARRSGRARGAGRTATTTGPRSDVRRASPTWSMSTSTPIASGQWCAAESSRRHAHRGADDRTDRGGSSCPISRQQCPSRRRRRRPVRPRDTTLTVEYQPASPGVSRWRDARAARSNAPGLRRATVGQHYDERHLCDDRPVVASSIARADLRRGEWCHRMERAESVARDFDARRRCHSTSPRHRGNRRGRLMSLFVGPVNRPSTVPLAAAARCGAPIEPEIEP